ncbi:hypothetical protein QBC45DRAFT_326972, partial [Copromyces sp. CBS 386.78]
GDPEREGPECPPPDSSQEKLGTELEAPPEFPMVKNFMRSETRIRNDGSQISHGHPRK